MKVAKTLYLSRLFNLLNPSNPLTNTFHGVDSDSNSLGGTIFKATYSVAFLVLKFLSMHYYCILASVKQEIAIISTF